MTNKSLYQNGNNVPSIPVFCLTTNPIEFRASKQILPKHNANFVYYLLYYKQLHFNRELYDRSISLPKIIKILLFIYCILRGKGIFLHLNIMNFQFLVIVKTCQSLYQYSCVL